MSGISVYGTAESSISISLGSLPGAPADHDASVWKGELQLLVPGSFPCIKCTFQKLLPVPLQLEIKRIVRWISLSLSSETHMLL